MHYTTQIMKQRRCTAPRTYALAANTLLRLSPMYSNALILTPLLTVSPKTLLKTSLSSNTPKQLTRMLLHGLEQWEAMETISTSPKPLFHGSLVTAEIALIQAFHNQSAIEWDHLLRGRLSKHWEHASNGRHSINNLGKNSDYPSVDLLYVSLEAS